MSITIELPPELEADLRRRAAETKRTPEEYATFLVEMTLKASIPPRKLTGEEWLNELKMLGSKVSPSTPPADDSRDSIYEGRGE